MFHAIEHVADPKAVVNASRHGCPMADISSLKRQRPIQLTRESEHVI
jgi:hypothetical protein